MCCFITSLLLAGPRAAILVWWLLFPVRFNVAFSTILWPILGIIFVPWTTLMYLAVWPNGVVGFDWFWIALGILFDIGMHAGGGYGNRSRIPGYR